MRLTLRTLLAYRDGVLDPKEAALLEEKIKESSTAQQISQRIETGMRNRKIAPIPVDAREFGFEANLVAEFLDIAQDACRFASVRHRVKRWVGSASSRVLDRK